MEYICIKDCENNYCGKTYTHKVGDRIFYYNFWFCNPIYLNNQLLSMFDARNKGYVDSKFILRNFKEFKKFEKKTEDKNKTLKEVNQLFENLMQ